MFKFAVAILAAVALIGAVGVQADCSGSSVSTPGTPMSVTWAFASGELTGIVTTAQYKTALTAQTVTISCTTGADLTCSSTEDITGCSFDYSEIDGCVTADAEASLDDYDKARQYVLTGTLAWTETYSFCRAAGTDAVTGSRSQSQPFQVTVTVPTQDTATTESIEIYDTWNTGLGVTSVTVTRVVDTAGTLDYDFVASVQYPYEVQSVSIEGGTANSGTGGSCEDTEICTRSFSVSGVSAACAGGAVVNSATFRMTIGCSDGGADDCPFQSGETPTVDATVSITVGDFCVKTVEGSFTLTLTSHHPGAGSGCAVAAQDDFYYDDTADVADSICLKAAVTDVGADKNFGVTSVGFNKITVVGGDFTEGIIGVGTQPTDTTDEKVVGTKDFEADLEPTVDSKVTKTFQAVVDVGYAGGSKRRSLLSVASQTLTHTVSLSRGTAGNGAAAAATADNSLVTATSTTSSASTIAIIVGAVAVVSLVAVIAGVAVRRNNQQNAKSVAAMEAALRKANDTAAPKEEVEAASASTTAADSAVSASSSSGEYYYSYTTASSSV